MDETTRFRVSFSVDRELTDTEITVLRDALDEDLSVEAGPLGSLVEFAGAGVSFEDAVRTLHSRLDVRWNL